MDFYSLPKTRFWNFAFFHCLKDRPYAIFSQYIQLLLKGGSWRLFLKDFLLWSVDAYNVHHDPILKFWPCKLALYDSLQDYCKRVLLTKSRRLTFKSSSPEEVPEVFFIIAVFIKDTLSSGISFFCESSDDKPHLVLPSQFQWDLSKAAWNKPIKSAVKILCGFN